MTERNNWLALVNVLGGGLIWALIAAPSAAVITLVLFGWFLPWLYDTVYIDVLLLALVASMVGFFGGFFVGLLRQVPNVLRLPLWCQVVHVTAVLATGYVTAGLAALAIDVGRDFWSGL